MAGGGEELGQGAAFEVGPADAAGDGAVDLEVEARRRALAVRGDDLGEPFAEGRRAAEQEVLVRSLAGGEPELGEGRAEVVLDEPAEGGGDQLAGSARPAGT